MRSVNQFCKVLDKGCNAVYVYRHSIHCAPMISNKCYYGLKAMLELALREGTGPVTIGDIAESQAIPVRFLEAILRQLKQAGFADSARGKEGGYFLARPPQSIKAGEIIRLFEGTLIAVSNSAQSAAADGSTQRCVFEGLWKEAEAEVNRIFDGVTLATLVERERARSATLATSFTI